jgi:hypothetical protein
MAVQCAIIKRRLATYNAYDGGRYKISSVVSRLGIPGVYRVMLYRRDSGRLISETKSAPDGSYTFRNIAMIDSGYYAVAFDHSEESCNAAISDLLTPTPMS